jgi:hypothetical protein
MNCESHGKPLCQNGWQTRALGNGKERVPCNMCRRDAWVGWAKNWHYPKPEKTPDRAA